MNKSTPLSQLPGASPHMAQQQPFLNEQHKQMVSNAQAAIQNVSLPQNTQISADIANDDDATIQEVLNQINTGGSTIPQPPIQVQDYIPQQYPQQLQQPLQYPSTFIEQPMKPMTNNSIDVLLNVFADDIKIAILVMVAFIVVNFIPITNILGRYVAIEKIPYHDILLKAVLAAAIVLVIKKIALKI